MLSCCLSWKISVACKQYLKILKSHVYWQKKKKISGINNIYVYLDTDKLWGHTLSAAGLTLNTESSIETWKKKISIIVSKPMSQIKCLENSE